MADDCAAYGNVERCLFTRMNRGGYELCKRYPKRRSAEDRVHSRPLLYAFGFRVVIVRRHISKAAERNALEVLQIDKARTALHIQPRRPLSIESNDPRLKAALIIMERNIEQTVSIDKLAASVGLSRRQLERLFVEKANSSPAIIYRRMRLERAKHLVMETTAPLIEIAMEVGFENASHFAKAFRKAFGQSPTKLRDVLAVNP